MRVVKATGVADQLPVISFRGSASGDQRRAISFRRSAFAEYGGPNLREMVVNIPGYLPVAFRGRLDSQRPEQIRGWRTRVARVPQRGMQAVGRQMVKDQVDDAPRVVGLLRQLIWPVHRAPPG